MSFMLQPQLHRGASIANLVLIVPHYNQVDIPVTSFVMSRFSASTLSLVVRRLVTFMNLSLGHDVDILMVMETWLYAQGDAYF